MNVLIQTFKKINMSSIKSVLDSAGFRTALWNKDFFSLEEVVNDFNPTFIIGNVENEEYVKSTNIPSALLSEDCHPHFCLNRFTKPEKTEHLECEFAFVGDPNLQNIHLSKEENIKIFSNNKPWTTYKFCGFIEDSIKPSLYFTAKKSPRFELDEECLNVKVSEGNLVSNFDCPDKEEIINRYTYHDLAINLLSKISSGEINGRIIKDKESLCSRSGLCFRA